MFKLVAAIGKPLKLYQSTSNKDKLMYARIMVEAIMNQELLEFENEKGIIMTQQVMYEWCLVQCSRCQDIGHIGNKCKHKKQLVQPWKKWVPKKITKRCRWVCEGGTTIYTLQ